MLLIDNGKKPDQIYSLKLGFWLPPDSPYGNFQLKHQNIILRLDEANRKIIECHQFWSHCKSNLMLPVGVPERHRFAYEEAIYMLRRVGDDLVSLIWCLTKLEETGEYPKKIKVDSLGKVMIQDEEDRHPVFSPHIYLITILNDISNAFKHSFINTDNTLIGNNEIRVHALDLPYNKAKSKYRFYDISLTELIIEYNKFYKSCYVWLKKFSERNRNNHSRLTKNKSKIDN